MVLVRAFCTYVRPILEYCTPVWSPHHIGLDDKIEKVQRRFTKRIYGFSNLSYEKKVNFEMYMKTVSYHLNLTLFTLDV